MIRYTKLGRLGEGGQGEVHEVVDMYNGNHYVYLCLQNRPDTSEPAWQQCSKGLSVLTEYADSVCRGTKATIKPAANLKVENQT